MNKKTCNIFKLMDSAYFNCSSFWRIFFIQGFGNNIIF